MLLQNIVSAFIYQVDDALRDSTVSLSSFEAPLQFILAIYEARPRAPSITDMIAVIFPDVFIFGHLFPIFYDLDDDLSFRKARRIWALWLAEPQTEQHPKAFIIIKEKLRDLLGDVQARPT
jgi:hypothetical protein